MVIFATTKSAYKEMESLILTGLHPVWLSNGVLEQEDIEELWAKGIDLSVLNYEVDSSNTEDIDCALSTVKEHHYGQNIWVQFENKN